MHYIFQLLPHPNIHYQEALKELGANELHCILGSLGIDTEITLRDLGGSTFLVFDAPELSPEALRRLSGHSALLLFLQEDAGCLRVLDKADPAYLPRDLAEVLKYKGKTSATFTQMMINCALSVSDFADAQTPITVLDPMCGKGTTAFCALQRGMNAVGIDVDEADLAEADRYLTRYMQLHHLKHQRAERSLTIGGRGVKQTVYTLAATREAYQQKDVRTLALTAADTAKADAILRKTPAELLVVDLPYGIQHAPQTGRKPEPFLALMKRALPAWRNALRPGAAIAISFNTLTLPRAALADAVAAAGFEPLDEAPFNGFRHFVEQAVMRDVLLARRP